ncbi:MAG: hypothetical protein LAT55_06990 [Opitutales bacterium]|nr:hypothetical protein [Opitutales bacterium]
MKIRVLRFLDLGLREIVGPKGKFSRAEFLHHLLALEEVTEEDLRGDHVWMSNRLKIPICHDLLMIRLGMGGDYLRELSMPERVQSLSEIIEWDVPNDYPRDYPKVFENYREEEFIEGNDAIISLILHKLITPLNLMNFVVRFQGCWDE